MFSCMRTNPLQDAPATRFNVDGMPKKIEIEVPDEFYAMLEKWAGIEGISLVELVQRELGRTKSPTNEEIFARLRASQTSNVDMTDVVRDIRRARGD
jgi:hypothetical protein